MQEELLITARANPKIDPVLSIWSWEIPVYLFLGGLTAGIMFFVALMTVQKKHNESPFVVNKLALWAPIALSVGMVALFLDLEHKWFVFRFYTSFQPTSPMSWGAWILTFIYPISILQILSTFRAGYPRLASYVDRFGMGTWLMDVSAQHRRLIAFWAIPFAVALGTYTGILLSAFSARPFWHTGILGLLFLVSGLSTAAALVVLGARQHQERYLFTVIEVVLIVVELFIVALLIVDLSTGVQLHLNAIEMIFGGTFTFAFWVYFVAMGLSIPLLLKTRELRGGQGLTFLAPLLVLFGGYMLRYIVVEAGQISAWIDYGVSYDTELLQRLRMVQ